MLSKEYRFHSRGGVKYVYRHGKTIRRPELSLTFCENERGKTRFAVVVSKKVLKTAVGRNRIRRRIYEAIRLDLDKFKKPRDYIFVIYNRSIENLPFNELQKTLRSLIEESMLQ
ncbi:ribonuclease P protein component [Candidatus Saccharibacteria bacterium]|nr:ribonuclease P protein component [Candidatus Saccharibacteria bacterium]